MISSMYRFWVGSSESSVVASTSNDTTAFVDQVNGVRVVGGTTSTPSSTETRATLTRQCQEEKVQATETSALLAGSKSKQNDEEEDGLSINITEMADAEASANNNNNNNIESVHSSALMEPLDSFRTAASTTPPPPPAEEEEFEEKVGEIVNGKRQQRPQEPPSVHDFFFPSNNSTIQRYYRFTATPLTPIAALYKRPMTTSGSAGSTSASSLDNYNSASNSNNSEVTGLLRRSAIVP